MLTLSVIILELSCDLKKKAYKGLQKLQHLKNLGAKAT